MHIGSVDRKFNLHELDNKNEKMTVSSECNVRSICIQLVRKLGYDIVMELLRVGMMGVKFGVRRT